MIMASIRKRKGKYQVQVRVRGKGTSATFQTLDHARRWARKIELELEQSIKVGKSYQPKTLLEILDRYKEVVIPLKKSATNERIILNTFMRSKWVAKPLKLLNPSYVADYRDQRLLKVKPSTLAREFCIIRHALNVAKLEWGWEVPIELFQNVKLPKLQSKAVRRISDDDLKLLMQAATDHSNIYLKPIIQFALETGMRRGELLSLQWKDIDYERKLITIDQTKNGYPRFIEITKSMNRILKNLVIKNEYVFPLSMNSLRLSYQRLCDKLGVKIRFHDFRHEAISRFFEKGYSIPHIASISGHRTLSQLFRYAHYKRSF